MTGKPNRDPARAATWLAVLAAITVLAGAGAVWSALRAEAVREGNAAIADEAATAEVSRQVGESVKAIFSYSFRDLGRTERAARGALVDAAVEQYRSRFAEASKQALRQRLVRSTTVRAVGVRSLSPDRAHLLVFVDQQTIADDGRPRGSTSACLDVVARKVDGVWKLSQLAAV
ncbi:hypothetical protein SacmaDRAFT_5557 [Saccharomonospora marina XMU15]|uniref:Mce-associated membrane protein n=1 Tax=Saccharomonospora marina XMU15 TaxID=882083 RepID=H5XA13_9PSEU|nr:hypothetical protein [Saccharomonospora marina]EHR53673.1 hypothetical protein SacmaDRAFT_5557 [Saccharomonospora marina XMU15]